MAAKKKAGAAAPGPGDVDFGFDIDALGAAMGITDDGIVVDEKEVDKIVASALKAGKKETEVDDKKVAQREAKKVLVKGMADIKRAVAFDNHEKFKEALNGYTGALPNLSGPLAAGVFDDESKAGAAAAASRKENLTGAVQSYITRVEEIEIMMKKGEIEEDLAEELKAFKAIRPKLCQDLALSGVSVISIGTAKRKEALALVQGKEDSALTKEEIQTALVYLFSAIDWFMGFLKTRTTPEEKNEPAYGVVQKTVAGLITEVERLKKL